MYKLAIFEDEPLILHSLCQNINWNSVECQICASGHDAAEARTLIEQEEPDIIITDIRMGDTSGLELCRWLNETRPQIKKIIITGYASVDYAKQAFKSAVADFILKPIDHSELLGAVSKAAAELRQERHLYNNIDTLTQTLNSYKSQLIEKFLIELASGQECSNEILFERMNELQIDLSGYFCLALDTSGALTHITDENSVFSILNCELQYNTLIEHFKCLHYCLFQQRYYCICSISESFSQKTLPHIMQTIQSDIQALQQRLVAVFHCPLYICHSDIYQYPHEFYQCFQQVNGLIERRFFVQDSNILSDNSVLEEPHEMDPATIRSWSELIISHIVVADRNAAFDALDQLWQQLSVLSEDEAKYKCLAFFVSFKEQLEPYRISVTETLSTDILIHAFRTPISFFEIKDTYFIPLIHSCLEQRLDVLKKTTSISEKVSAYIRDNIGEQQLSVAMIAQHFNYNAKYLSMMVKKECGKTIIDIITDVRMEIAKELLANTNSKTYSIAQQVGILDARYFGQIFRKKTGLTPKEYRALHFNETL